MLTLTLIINQALESGDWNKLKCFHNLLNIYKDIVCRTLLSVYFYSIKFSSYRFSFFIVCSKSFQDRIRSVIKVVPIGGDESIMSFCRLWILNWYHFPICSFNIDPFQNEKGNKIANFLDLLCWPFLIITYRIFTSSIAALTRERKLISQWSNAGCEDSLTGGNKNCWKLWCEKNINQVHCDLAALKGGLKLALHYFIVVFLL